MDQHQIGGSLIAEYFFVITVRAAMYFRDSATLQPVAGSLRPNGFAR